jgi:hypothetical protein
VYAHYYNIIHSQTYYIFIIRPIWTLEHNEIIKTFNIIHDYWLDKYYHPMTIIAFGISILFNIIFYKKANKLLLTSLVLLFIGSLLYLSLWFVNLSQHDYYLISIYITVIISFLTSLDILAKNFHKIIKSPFFIGLAITFTILNIIYTRDRVHERYHGWENGDLSRYQDLFTITPYLRSIGIERTDKVICVPDQSVNYSLYLSNQIGWTSFSGALNDSSSFNSFIESGAKYLFVIGSDILTNYNWLKQYTYHQIGEYGNVDIYKLDNKNDSSFLKNKINISIFCNAEKFTADSNLLSTTYNIKFPQINQLSNTFHHSGKHSIKITKENPYGFSTLFKNVIAGDVYKISAWRYPAGSASNIVACIKSPNDLLITNAQVTDSDSNGWEKIETTFKVPLALSLEKLSVHIEYKGDSCAYFDDLTINQLTNKIKH